MRTHYPDTWISHNLLNGYVTIDPMLQKTRTTIEALCWAAITAAPESLNMMEQAIKLGLGQSGFGVS